MARTPRSAELFIPLKYIGFKPSTTELEKCIESIRTSYAVEWDTDPSLRWVGHIDDEGATCYLRFATLATAEKAELWSSFQRQRVIGEIIGYLKSQRAVHLLNSTRSWEEVTLCRTGTGFKATGIKVEEDDAGHEYTVWFEGRFPTTVHDDTSKEVIAPRHPLRVKITTRAALALSSAYPVRS